MKRGHCPVGVSPGKGCERPGKLPQAFLQPWETHWRSGPEQNLTLRSSLPSVAVWTLPTSKETSMCKPVAEVPTPSLGPWAPESSFQHCFLFSIPNSFLLIWLLCYLCSSTTQDRRADGPELTHMATHLSPSLGKLVLYALVRWTYLPVADSTQLP